MKRLMFAAAASLAAGMLVAQDSQECCPKVYDFKASIKNSNVKQVLDKNCQSVVDVKFVESSTLNGWLVLFCATDCCKEEDEGMRNGWLYLYRSKGPKNVYVVPVSMILADRFVSGMNKTTCEPQLGSDAEGALIINTDVVEFGWPDTLAGFFNDEVGTVYPFVDSGFTVFGATGFGKVTSTKSTYEMVDTDEDPCTPPERIEIPGCTVLDSLSGSIIGVMIYDYVCNVPFQSLCLNQDFRVTDDFFNAVATGTWSIRRNLKFEVTACESQEDFEDEILKKLRGYTIVDNAD